MSDMELNTDSVGIKKQEVISVYILMLANRKHYTGLTGNMDRRLQEHMNGQSKSTCRHLPVKLIFVVTIEGRQEARRLEVRIKRRGAGRWLNQLRYSPLRYEYDIEKEPNEWNRERG